jgi:hypothetical protein
MTTINKTFACANLTTHAFALAKFLVIAISDFDFSILKFKNFSNSV